MLHSQLTAEGKLDKAAIPRLEPEAPNSEHVECNVFIPP